MKVDLAIERVVLEGAPIGADAVAALLEDIFARLATHLQEAGAQWPSAGSTQFDELRLRWPEGLSASAPAAVDRLAFQLFEQLMRGVQ